MRVPVFSEEAILAMPFQFVQPILHSAPDSARPLKKVDPGKGKKYLELADILLRRFPSSTSGRPIEFLVDLCRNRNPGPLAPIPFYSTPGQQDLVVIPANPGLARVAPTIRFEAMLQRRPWGCKKYPCPHHTPRLDAEWHSMGILGNALFLLNPVWQCVLKPFWCHSSGVPNKMSSSKSLYPHGDDRLRLLRPKTIRPCMSPPLDKQKNHNHPSTERLEAYECEGASGSCLKQGQVEHLNLLEACQVWDDDVLRPRAIQEILPVWLRSLYLAACSESYFGGVFRELPISSAWLWFSCSQGGDPSLFCLLLIKYCGFRSVPGPGPFSNLHWLWCRGHRFLSSMLTFRISSSYIWCGLQHVWTSPGQVRGEQWD